MISKNINTWGTIMDTKKIILILGLVGSCGAALAAVQTYENMDLPRPAMKSELVIVEATGLETQQMILEESYDRRQLQLYQNQRVQQEYELQAKPVPESLGREELLLEKETSKLKDRIDLVKEKRMNND